MDGKRFDDLTKAMSGVRPSRRAMLRGLAGGALAGVLGGRALGASAQDVTIQGDAICEGREVICSSAGGPGFNCADGCVCARNTNGEKQCVDGLADTCRGRTRCQRNRDCDDGQVCIRVAGCSGSACQRGRGGRCFDRCQAG